MEPRSMRYSLPFIFVHWLLALIIVVALALGWYSQYLPSTVPHRLFVVEIHISLGLTGAILALVQIVMRIVAKPPPLPESFPRWAAQLAFILYLLIYLCLVLMPASGYLQMVYSGAPVKFWGFPLPAWGEKDAPLAEFYWTIHGMAAFVLSGLIVVHIVMVIISYFQHLGLGARMMPGTPLEPGLPVEAKPVPPDAIALAKKLARNLRLTGWVAFWLQLALAFISGLLLVFATSGRAFSPSQAALGDGMFWAALGFFILCVTLILSLHYTRRARQITARPIDYMDPRRKLAFWFLGIGMLLGLIGIIVSFSGVAASIALLIAKTISQPPGIAITDPNKIIRALDVFILLVNFNLLIAHFIGTGSSFWLVVRATKTRHSYQLMPSNSS